MEQKSSFVSNQKLELVCLLLGIDKRSWQLIKDFYQSGCYSSDEPELSPSWASLALNLFTEMTANKSG